MADPPGSPPTAKLASQGAHLQACDLSARARDEGDGGKGGGGGGGWGMLVGLEDMGEVIPRRGVGGRNKGGGGLLNRSWSRETALSGLFAPNLQIFL